MVEQRAEEGVFRGPAFCEFGGGDLQDPAELEGVILDVIEEIQSDDPTILDGDLDVRERVGISRSFRRGSTTEARNQGLSDSDIDAMNRWRSFEEAKGKRPGLKMRDHYAEKSNMLKTLLRYPSAV